MGNLYDPNWPTPPWYVSLFDFLTGTYILPFSATLVMLALMLTVSFISSRPTR